MPVYPGAVHGMAAQPVGHFSEDDEDVVGAAVAPLLQSAIVISETFLYTAPVGSTSAIVMSLTFLYVPPVGSMSAIVISETCLYTAPVGSTSAIVISSMCLYMSPPGTSATVSSEIFLYSPLSEASATVHAASAAPVHSAGAAAASSHSCHFALS